MFHGARAGIGPFVPFTGRTGGRIYHGMKTSLQLSLAAPAPEIVRSGGFARRPVSNRTTPARESSAQPIHQAASTTRFRKPGLLYPAPSAATLPQPAPFAARNHSPVRSLRLGSAAKDREYRRAVRAAEMMAWNAAMPAVEATGEPSAALARTSRVEKLVANSLLLLALGFACAAWLAANPARFLTVARQLEVFLMRLIGG